MDSSIYSQYGINPYSDTRGSDLSAAITRAQYDDYQTRFLPWLDNLTDTVSDSSVAETKQYWQDKMLGQADSNAQNTAAATSRNQSRFGLAIDDRTQKSNNSLNDAAFKASAVKGINEMNQAVDDRVLTLLSGQKLSGD